MMHGIDWKPNGYAAKGILPNGIEWAVFVADHRTLQERSVSANGLWKWRTEITVGNTSAAAEGVVVGSDKAMRTSWEALERLAHAFCTEAPEDWPLSLSSLLAAAESRRPGDWASDENFKSACEHARRVLQRVPKEMP